MTKKAGDIHYDTAFKAEVRAARVKGQTYTAIAERFGVNMASVYRWCNPPKNRGLSQQAVISVKIPTAHRDALIALGAANGETLAETLRRVIATAVPHPEPAIARMRGEGEGAG